MVKGWTRAAAQDEQGRALARGVVVLWYMVQQVRGVWAVVALALCGVVCTSRCLAAQCWNSACLTKQGRASPGVNEAYEKQRAPLNYFKGKGRGS